jgi:hypothetical protein
LNDQGRLLLIFDGFDEMKHGMTFAMFRNNVNEIMRLDRGRAKITILGRDTVSANDREFKSVVLGRQFTHYGQEVDAANRRALQHVKLRGFSPDDAKRFVSKYFRERLSTTKPRREEWKRKDWVEQRLRQIESHADLISRPVHAQMLCDVATDPRRDMTTMNAYRLYDVFIHYLIDREVAKKGRYPKFDTNHRRKFAELLAWWLWRAGGASTTTQSDIPGDILRMPVANVQHEFDDEGLRRELVIGCMVEKAGGGLYFPHRSIQEFLVAEYIWHVLTELRDREFSEAATPEVLEFVVQKFELSAAQSTYVDTHTGVELLSRLLAIARERRIDNFEEFKRAFRIGVCLSSRSLDQVRAPSTACLLFFFARNKSMSFRAETAEAVDYLRELTSDLRVRPDRAKVAVYLWLETSCTRSPSQEEVAQIIFQMLPRDDLAKRLKSMTASRKDAGRDDRIEVKDGETLGLWFFATFVEPRMESDEQWLCLKRGEAIEYLRARGFGYEELGGHERRSAELKCPAGLVYDNLRQTKIEGRLLQQMWSFVTSPSVRSIFHFPTASAGAGGADAPSRGTASIPDANVQT